MAKYEFTLTTPQDSCSFEADTWSRLAALVLSQVSRITRESVHLESDHSIDLAVSMMLAMFNARYQKYRATNKSGICSAGLERDVASCYLQGMTIKRALGALADKGLRPLFMGSGFAIEQIPAPGEPVDQGGWVQVNFRSQLEPDPPAEELIPEEAPDVSEPTGAKHADPR